jgi:hypothetical protein
VTPARFLRILRQRLKSLIGWRAQDRAIDDELAVHLDRLIQE